MTINEIKRENGNIYLEMILCHRDFDRFFVYCEDCGEIVLKEKAIEIETDELECPLMKLKKGETILYEDGKTEEYEDVFHNLYLVYLTKDGDIYADFADSITYGRIRMENLTYLGTGYIVNSKSPIGINEFRKDAVGFI